MPISRITTYFTGHLTRVKLSDLITTVVHHHIRRNQISDGSRYVTIKCATVQVFQELIDCDCLLAAYLADNLETVFASV